MDPLQAKANFSRVCQLLVDKGGEVLRRTLQTKINTSPPPSTLDSLLNAHKRSLQKIRYSVINASQWKLLFPASGSADSKNFDITLLTILLRHICGLPSPAAGWNVMPPASDTSISAEILRIKMFRNEVYGHITSAQLDDTEFETLWREISRPLIKLGIPPQDIQELKEAPLSPEEGSYIERLKEWKELEVDIFTKLSDLQDELSHLRAAAGNTRPSQTEMLSKFNLIGKIRTLCAKFHSGTKQWIFDKLSRWFHSKESSVMILSAGPGVGKSVLSAKICHLYKESRQLAACHFCDFRTSDYRDPHKILQSLACQMCDNVDGFREVLTKALAREHSRHTLSDAFRIFFNDPLHALNRNEPMLIVIDALDESKTDTKSEFLELISEEFFQLPKWIKIFITSRPELQVKKKLEHLDPLEILPDDEQHKHDLKQFMKFCLPEVSVPNVESLVNKCEGSFLYAFYLVNEVKQKLEIDNVDKYVPQGISGFYEKQFKRLKTELQRYEQNTEVSIFKRFLNVVAASQEPLPLRTLFTCLGLSNQEFEIRETIIGIMSEILPVYEDCLTVFHKSLCDWLKLDGYEEHAYAADVADGEKHLWRACKKVYMDIASLSSVVKFQISLEKRYALENGWKYLVSVGDPEDFQWLAHVKVNYFKFKYSDRKRIIRYVCPKLFDILQKYKSRIPDDLYWRLSQLYTFSNIVWQLRNVHTCMGYMYLQYLAGKQFGFIQTATTCIKDAKKALNEVNTIWFEEVQTNETNSSFKIISNALFNDPLSVRSAFSLSPDHKLLVWKYDKMRDVYVDVHELPNFTVIFRVHLSTADIFYENIVFSPDSSYFLLSSVKTCISIKSQKKVPFIPHGPAPILCCSFSSCGTKLVTVERGSIKVWNVREKVILVESGHNCNSLVLVCFSTCDSYIFVYFRIHPKLNVFDSTTLNKLKTKETFALPRNDNNIQVLSPFYFEYDLWYSHIHECWQLPTGENILGGFACCSKPFTWKKRKCVIKSNDALAWIVYDYINQEVVDTIEISCLQSYNHVQYLSNLGENKFLVCLDDHFMFVLSLESPSESLSFPFFCDELFPLFFALSPDNLYVAYSYGSPFLRIMNVDNGRTLQIWLPKERPIACWWSQLYLWVVCEGPVVIKYPYNSAHRNVKNCVEERYLRGCVLKFAEAVLVTELDEKISVSKIFQECLSPQQVLDSKLNNMIDSPSVQISSDGSAILLYDTNDSHYYEVWEIGRENKWQLFSAGTLDHSFAHGYLIWKKNCWSSLWLSTHQHGMVFLSDLSSIDLQKGALDAVHKLPIHIIDGTFTYLPSDLLICAGEEEIHFIQVSNNNVITSIPVGMFHDFLFVSTKRLLLVFRRSGVIKHFNIHNIDRFLPL